MVLGYIIYTQCVCMNIMLFIVEKNASINSDVMISTAPTWFIHFFIYLLVYLLLYDSFIFASFGSIWKNSRYSWYWINTFILYVIKSIRKIEFWSEDWNVNQSYYL